MLIGSTPHRSNLFFPRLQVAAKSLLCGATWMGVWSAAASGWATDVAGSISGRPLAAHAAAAGATMFAQLPPAQTGVVATNDFSDPAMWGKLYQEYEGGSLGTGVAIGDYDGDGRPDLFVVSRTESCRLFRNLGGFKFED